jgi:hypothetical protein
MREDLNCLAAEDNRGHTMAAVCGAAAVVAKDKRNMLNKPDLTPASLTVRF